MRSILTYSEHSKKKTPDPWGKYIQSQLQCKKFFNESSKDLPKRKQKIQLFFDKSKIKIRKSVQSKQKSPHAKNLVVMNKYGAWICTHKEKSSEVKWPKKNRVFNSISEMEGKVGPKFENWQRKFIEKLLLKVLKS